MISRNQDIENKNESMVQSDQTKNDSPNKTGRLIEPDKTIHPVGGHDLNKDASATAIGFSNSSEHKRESSAMDKNCLPYIDNLNMRESIPSLKPFNDTGISFMSPISSNL